MNKKVIIGAVVALLVVAYGGYRWWLASVEKAAVEWTGPVKEIVRESMVKEGDTWHIQFETIFEAPVARVFEAYTQPERAHELVPDRVLASDLKSSTENSKVVEIRGRVLNLPLQRLVIQYDFKPAERRISSRTLEYNLADITSEYVFEPSPDGQKTVLRFSQTSKDKLGNPLPESVQKGALKETYVTTVRTVRKALGLPAAS